MGVHGVRQQLQRDRVSSTLAHLALTGDARVPVVGVCMPSSSADGYARSHHGGADTSIALPQPQSLEGQFPGNNQASDLQPNQEADLAVSDQEPEHQEPAMVSLAQPAVDLTAASGLSEPDLQGALPQHVQQHPASEDEEVLAQEQDAAHTEDLAVRWVVHSNASACCTVQCTVALLVALVPALLFGEKHKCLCHCTLLIYHSSPTLEYLGLTHDTSAAGCACL